MPDLMRNNPKYHRGPCYAPTLDEYHRVKNEIIPKIRRILEGRTRTDLSSKTFNQKKGK